jgi:hypothetical protein
MTTVFGNKERDLFNAFFISDSSRRRAALDKWIQSTTPIIQSAIMLEIQDFIELFMENAWTDEGWNIREEKIRQIENTYHLVLEI